MHDMLLHDQQMSFRIVDLHFALSVSGCMFDSARKQKTEAKTQGPDTRTWGRVFPPEMFRASLRHNQVAQCCETLGCL